jgi:hypothetical protein
MRGELLLRGIDIVNTNVITTTTPITLAIVLVLIESRSLGGHEAEVAEYEKIRQEEREKQERNFRGNFC